MTTETMAPEQTEAAAANVPPPTRNPRSAVADRASRPRSAPAARGSTPRPAPTAREHIPPKAGHIRLLCVQDYRHGHRVTIPGKVLAELGEFADFDKNDIRRAVTDFKAGTEYHVEAQRAIRMLRDLGPSRYRNPLTEKVERRPDSKVYFHAVDRSELDRYLDAMIDADEARRDHVPNEDIEAITPPDED